jgi:hypothetical protein
MDLDTYGDPVTGSYDSTQGSRIEGTVTNGRLTYRYTEPSAAGEGWFEVSADGQTIAGQWRADGSDSWSGWDGQRAIPTFTGAWDTDYGRMLLTEENDTVTGTYEPDGVIEGTIMQDGLRFRYADSSGVGEGVFQPSRGSGGRTAGTGRPGTAPAFPRR